MATLSLDARELLGRLWEETQVLEDKEKLRMAVDALRFITSTGQSYEFEEYRKSLDAKAPPLVSASFNTREEAEAWLARQPEPPRQVFITIAGESHLVAYHHRINLRAIYPVSLAAKPKRE